MTRQQIADQANEIRRLARSGGGAPKLSAASSRTTVLDWCQWADPNGWYTDAAAKAEGEDPTTEETAWELLEGLLKDA